jgi:hypothetical protein
MIMDDGNRRQGWEEYTGPSFGIAFYPYDHTDRISDLFGASRTLLR